MKLCFLVNADSIHSYRWIKYFAERGHEVYWISIAPNSFDEIKGVNFYLLRNFSCKLLNIIFNISSFKKILRKINPDILHVHYAGVNGVLGALSRFYPFVLTAWGSDVLVASKSRIVRPLVKIALKGADLITCDAEHMKNAMIKLGADSSKIRIIYFGIDTEKFKPGPRNENLITKLELRNYPIIISLRSLEPIYNLETLIKAVPLVLKECSETKFIIAGKGSEEDRLKKIVKGLKIEDSVRFVGFVPNTELISYLRTSDIYVSTALSDAGLSASTAEAMACGLPVVITNSGENSKWVNDGENGFIIPVKNAVSLAEKIIFLLKNKNVGKKMGEKARRTIEEKNNYYVEMAKMEQIYWSILKLLTLNSY